MLNAHGEGTGRSSSEDVITELMRWMAMKSGLNQHELKDQPDPVALVEMSSHICDAREAIWRGDSEPTDIVFRHIGTMHWRSPKFKENLSCLLFDIITLGKSQWK